jgi:hypothetical protein
MNHNPPQMVEEWRKLYYWDSGEVINLFNPTPGKLVKQCLCDREKLLQDIIKDTNKVETIIKDWDTDTTTTQLTATQEHHIVTQCLYLQKAYNFAVQCMNTWTWMECCAEAIKLLRDCGISYLHHEPTITKGRWHAFFQKNEMLPNPLGHSKKLLQAKVSTFFQD